MLNEVQKEKIEEFFWVCCIESAFVLGMLALFIIPSYLLGESVGAVISIILLIVVSVLLKFSIHTFP